MKKNETGNNTPTGATRNTAHDMGQITPSVIAVAQEQMKQVARQMTAFVQSQKELMRKAGKVIKEGYDITVFDALGEDWREQFDEEQLREIERRVNFFFREWERTDDKEALKKEWEQKIFDAVMANPPCAQKVWEAVILREAISRTREAERDGTGNSPSETPKAQHGANTGQMLDVWNVTDIWTETAKHNFKIARKKGYIEKTDDGYIWKLKTARLSYLINMTYPERMAPCKKLAVLFINVPYDTIKSKAWLETRCKWKADFDEIFKRDN